MGKKKSVFIIAAIVVVLLLLHSTPHLALRTHLVINGYPIIAVTTKIMDDEYHNSIDKEKFRELNAKAYTLSKPPIEKATDGELRNFLVRKVGFIHFVEYYGET